LFDICFTAISGGTTDIDITSDIAAIEFSDVDENVIPAVTNSGTINISGNPPVDGLTLTIADQTIAPGSQFCTSVSAFNFDDVVGMSFTITYDPALLQFNQVTNLTSNLPAFNAGANIGNPSPGFITVNWFEQSLIPTSLPDGEVVFDICFTALGSGVSTDLDFTSDVAAIEFSDANEDVIPFNGESGTINITGDPSGLTVSAESVTVGTAESFCVPVTVSNFTGIVGMSFTMNYDAGHVAYDQVTNINPGLTGFSVAANVGNPSPGFITVNWFEQSLIPVSLPNDAVLFEVCFDAVGTDGTSSDLAFTGDVAAIEFSDVNENVIPAFFEDATFSIEDNVPGQVTATISDAAVDLDQSVCVPLTVSNFTNVTDFGFTVEYDANILQLDQVTALNAMVAGFDMADIDMATPGRIAVSWSNGSPVTLANGATLFEMCFTAVGGEDSCTDLDITGSSEPVSFTSSDLGTLAFQGNSGTICVNSAFDGFRLTIADETVQPGDQFCLPVTVLNFNDVVGIAFTISYDPAQLQFQSVTNLNPNLSQFSVNANFGLPAQIGAGNISVNWFNQSIQPTNLPNGAVLFEMCFVAIGNDGQASDLNFSSGVTPIEVSDSNGEVIPFFSLSGTVNISAVQPPAIAFADITDVDCFGQSTGAIALTVNGGTGGPYTYSWSNGMSGSEITNLPGGSYTVTVADQGLGGLTTTASYTVDAPVSAVNVSGGVTAPTCNGGTNGSILLSVEGGTSGYNISWDNGIQAGTMNPSNLPGGTYCVTVTDANGCAADRCFNIPNGTGAGATIMETVTPVSCAGEEDGSISLALTGAIGEATYFWSTAPGQPSVSGTLNNLAPGSYTVTVIDGASCTSTGTFTVDGAISIEIDAEVSPIACADEANGSIELSVIGGAGGFSYSWTGPDNFTASTAAIDGLAAGTYQVSATDVNDCTITATYEVNEPADALAFAGITPQDITASTQGGVELDLTGGTMPYNYSWTGPNGFTSSSADLTGLTLQGEYCVTVTDANGCEVSSCAIVESVLRVNGDITDACFGEENGFISVVPDGGMPPYEYSWSNSASTGANLINLAAGTYSVTVMDSAGDMVTMTFVVEESPEITLDPVLVPVTGAPGDANGAITLNAGGGVLPFTYSWTGPNGFTATTPNISGLVQGTYCVTITDSNFGNGCSRDTCFDVFFVAPLGQPVVNVTNTSCSYTEDGILNIQISGGVPIFMIEITTAEGDVITGTSTNNAFSQAGLPAGSTSIVITDAQGNAVNETVIIESPAPLVVADPDYRHATEGNCNGQITLNITGGTPGYNVTWNNGAPDGPAITGLCSGLTYTPTVTDANGCEVEVPAVAINNFDVTVTSVTGTSCPEDANGAIEIDVVGGDPGYTYIWNNGQGQQVSDEEDPQGLMPGTYMLIITEPSGNTLTRMVVVETESALQVALQAESEYNGFEVSCYDAADGAVSAAASGSTGYLYEWTRLEDEMLVGTGTNLNNLQPGTYQVMVSDEFGCTMTQQIELSAPDTLQVAGIIQDITCHDGKDAIITATTQGGVEPFDFFWSNEREGNRIAFLEAGDYNVTVFDANNCQQVGRFTVENPDPITISFEVEPDTEACNGAVFATAEGGTEPYKYNWATLNTDAPQVPNLCTGEYLLQVSDLNGCLSELTTVVVENRRFPCLEEAVILTPDGNGANEEFVIFCVSDYPDNRLEIYNRWGEPVFEADNYSNDWNGRHMNGSQLPEGPYYYVFTYTDPDGNAQQQKGSLTILREQ
ncbi:cohesin domain-containing protein, partial [Phaeodactylibacter luteus]